MRTTKGEVSKSRLMESAAELFAQKGYAATTVSQIVASAGLTQAAFYLYFKSKEDILKELLEKFEQQMLQFSNAGRHVSEQMKEEREAYVARTFIGLFALFGTNPNLTKIALQETLEGEKFRSKIVNQIVTNMKMNQSIGIVNSKVDPELVAESVVAAVERLVYRYSITGEKSKEELGQQLASFFLNGVLNKS